VQKLTRRSLGHWSVKNAAGEQGPAELGAVPGCSTKNRRTGGGTLIPCQPKIIYGGFCL